MIATSGADIASEPRAGVVTPICREMPADLETPVSVYLKLRASHGPGFLLESVERGEQLGRYSFLGFRARRQIQARGHQVTIQDRDSIRTVQIPTGKDPLDIVRAEMQAYHPAFTPEYPASALPRFFGGAVGFVSYDMVRFFERLPTPPPDELGLPDLHLVFADELVVFDHVQHRLLLIANAQTPPGDRPEPALREAQERLDALETSLRNPIPAPPRVISTNQIEASTTFTQEAFEAAVRAAKAYIRAGDIFQVVLSQRLARPTKADPFSIYRTLRRINPSPYMFFIELEGNPPTCLIGSSPEMLVRLQRRAAEVHPIAGTRRRGQDIATDEALEAELRADEKEQAEHLMLVDLARNDLGRVCEFGTVRTSELLGVERYSHVMHLVSHVEGTLRIGLDAYDLLRAAFPAGTVSGAPKVRAMEIIDELEPCRRGPYAGAVGYFGFNGNMDTCITIRTIVMRGDIAYLQAGAGIVADSDPTREYHETLHKIRALSKAIDIAEEDT